MMPSGSAQGRVRVGVVGAGWVATARHIPAFKREPRVVLEAVLDPNSSKAIATAKRFRIPHSFHRIDEFLSQSLDLVSLCVPPGQHALLIEASLRAGKHVLVEKPMTLTAQEGRTLGALASEAGLLLCPAHNLLFSRCVQRTEAVLASGEAGHVKWAMGVQMSSWRRRLPSWFDDLPGGLFFDEAPHLLYLLRHFLGRLTVQHAWWSTELEGSPQRVERIEARLVGETGGGHLTMWFGAPLSEWVLILFCSRAVLVLDLFRDLFIRLPPEKAHNWRDVMGAAAQGSWQLWGGIGASGVRFVRGRLFYGHEVLIQRLVDSLTAGRAPPVTAQDGWEVVALMEEILRLAPQAGKSAG